MIFVAMMTALLLGSWSGRDVDVITGSFFLAASAVQLSAAAVAARGGRIPAWIGQTSKGQFLQGIGALGMGLMGLQGLVTYAPAGLLIAVVTVPAYVAGVVFEARHRQTTPWERA